MIQKHLSSIMALLFITTKIADIVQLVQMLVQRVMDKINGIVFILNTYSQWNQFSHAMLWSVIYEQLREGK